MGALRWTSDLGEHRAEDAVSGWAHEAVAYVAARTGSRWTLTVYLRYPESGGFAHSSKVIAFKVATLREAKRKASDYRQYAAEDHGLRSRTA